MSTQPALRIGTRKSKLAVWQAKRVQQLLSRAELPSRLVYISTEGDKVLDTPLPMFGGKGVFTKALDDALLAGEIDLAVHSFKDVPTRLPEGLQVGAVLQRAQPDDVFVGHPAAVTRWKNARQSAPKGTEGDPLAAYFADFKQVTIATGSNRRRAQWAERYPRHQIVDLRGNVQTRLQKIIDHQWAGAIFARAGLERLGLQARITTLLDWMIPAPAQGAIAVMCPAETPALERLQAALHHPQTARCVQQERHLLNILEGGCSAPLGALCETLPDGSYRLRGCLLSLDGNKRLDCSLTAPAAEAHTLGELAAKELQQKGATQLIAEIEAQKPEGSK